MVILSGSSNVPLAEAISKQLTAYNIKRMIRKFPNGELYARLVDDVKDQTVVIVQSLQVPVHEYLMEFLLLADAAKRAGASRIIGVIPWLAYSKQDKVFQPGEALSAQVIAKAISSAPLDNVYVLDLHARSERDFFTVPVEHLTLATAFVEVLRPSVTHQTIVVAPDRGGITRSVKFAKLLKLPHVEIQKERDKTTMDAKAIDISGSVRGKDCLIFDDLIATGSTVVADASYLRKLGAKTVRFCVTHGLFTRGIDIFEGVVDKILISDSIPVLQRIPPFVQVISVAGTIAHALGKEQ